MKELTMFDISNPLDDEQMMEIEGGLPKHDGYCGCACKGDNQKKYPGWSGRADNMVANFDGYLTSPD